MIKENISERLESPDDAVFKEAFLELKDSYDYTEKNMKGSGPYWCYKLEIERYKGRFNRLSRTSSHSTQSNTC